MNALRRSRRSISDFVRYALPWGDGIVRLKGGGFLRGYSVRGFDDSSSTWAARVWTAQQFALALSRLDSQWSVHVDVLRVGSRHYPQEGHWPDRLTWLLDQDRRERYSAEGAHYESRYVISLAYQPRGKVQRRFGGLLHRDLVSNSDEERDFQTFLTMTDEFARSVQSVFEVFRPLGLAQREVGGRAMWFDEYLAFLASCVRGYAEAIAVDPQEPQFLDGIIACEDTLPGWDARVGEQHVGVLTIEGYPDACYPGILSILDRLGMPSRWSTRYIPYSRLEAEKRLELIARSWRIVSLGIVGIFTGGALGRVDEVAGSWRGDTMAAKDDVVKGARTFGAYLSQVILFDRDARRVEEGLRAIKTGLESGVVGYSARIERENRIEGYLASLPGETDASDFRESFASARQCAYSVPLSAFWAGPIAHPNPKFGPDAPPLLWASGAGDTPFRLCLHDGEKGHALVFGGTRGGKSVLLNALIAAHLSRYRGARVFAYDVDYSLYKLCLGVGGRHFVVGGEGGQLALLGGIEDPIVRADRLRLIERTIVEPDVGRLSPATRAEMKEALEVLAASNRPRRLSTYAELVQALDVRQVLRDCKDGPFDADIDDLNFRAAFSRGYVPFFVFEYAALADNDAKVAPFVAYTQQRIMEALDDGASAPAMVVFDEGHRAVAIDAMEDLGELLARTAAKKLGQFVMASHSPMDFPDDGIGKVLPMLVACVIACRDPEIKSDEARAAAYRRFGFSEADLSTVATLPPFHYFYRGQAGSRVFTLGLSEFEVAIFGGASPEDRKRVDATIAQGGYRGWVGRYLRSLGKPSLEPYASAYEQLLEIA